MSEKIIENSHDAEEEVVARICFEAYSEIARLLNKQAHEVTNLAVCDWITDIIYKNIKKKYPEVIVNKKFQTWGIATHKFLEIEIKSEKWILDATWQQFMYGKHPDKPSVLWVKKSEISPELERLNIPELAHHIWLNPKSE